MQRDNLHSWLRQTGMMLGFLVALGCLQIQPATAHGTVAHGVGGVYRGGWQSSTTGHHGPMNVRLRQQSSGEVRALFTGRFAGVIPFVYRAKLEPTGDPGHFVSERQLPLMGTYRMSAVISPGGFYARYTSRKDVGSFQMRRVSR